jgi:hypothetical protein
MSKHADKTVGRKTRADARQERLAEELRSNLRKRKQQARARIVGESSEKPKTESEGESRS